MTSWAHKLEQLREAFDRKLIAEVKRYGGIPPLPPEEIALREAIAALLLEEERPS
jgi:hypothetical protein